MESDVRKILFDAVIDDFGLGESIGYLIDCVHQESPSTSTREAVAELRRAAAEGLMRVSFLTADGSERTPTDGDYEAAVASYAPNDDRDSIVEDSLVATLTCRGKAEWRKVADQWQLDLSKHGRVIEEESGEVTVLSACTELARQLLAEWLVAHPGAAVGEPPRVADANYSLSPGFPERGMRITWRLVTA